jgi:hypothetical protein
LYQAKLLLATYNDETVNVDMDVNICNYKQAVDACRQWEKSSVLLAQYCDCVLGVMAEEERNSRGGYVVLYIVLCGMHCWEMWVWFFLSGLLPIGRGAHSLSGVWFLLLTVSDYIAGYTM